MRNLQMATVGLLVLGLSLAPSEAGAKKRRDAPRCASKGSETLEQNARYRVYQRRADVIACDLKRGSRVRLGNGQVESGEGRYIDSERVLLRGSYVAFVEKGDAPSSQGPFTPQTIALVSLLKRSRLNVGETGCVTSDNSALVSSFALDRFGRLVWACVGDGATLRVEVRRFDATGSALLEASDSRWLPNGGGLSETPIDSRSVALTQTDEGSIAYWLRGDAPRAARLR